MNYIFVFTIFLTPILTFASIQDDACKAKENRLFELNIIATNIANVNTTRTPEGGAYRRKELVCFKESCEVKETQKISAKYEPNHPDADENGYVSYPDINLMQEMESMIQATHDFDKAAKNCK